MSRTREIGGRIEVWSEALRSWIWRDDPNPSLIAMEAGYQTAKQPMSIRTCLHLVGGCDAYVELPPRMSSEAWAHFLAILEALKPGYVGLQAEREEKS